LGVIVCVGEKLEEREKDETLQVVERQLEAVAGEISEADWKWVVVCLNGLELS
jgi:triosephosphate isomerase